MQAPDPVAGATLTIADATDGTRQPQRQCGRCRGYFDAEWDVDPRSLGEWWACPPCRDALFPPKFGPRDRHEA